MPHKIRLAALAAIALSVAAPVLAHDDDDDWKERRHYRCERVEKEVHHHYYPAGEVILDRPVVVYRDPPPAVVYYDPPPPAVYHGAWPSDMAAVFIGAVLGAYIGERLEAGH